MQPSAKSLAAAHGAARPNATIAGSAVRARRRVVLTAALLFFGALALRLYRLGAQSLWLDEGGTWAEVTGRTGKGWWALTTELWSKDAAYPLYHLLLKSWVALAGDSEWALRLPSALAGAGAVVALYLAAIELQGQRQKLEGHIAERDVLFLPFSFDLLPSLLLAVSPFALWYAQDAKVYSLLMCVIALLLWVLLRAAQRGTLRAWLLVLALAAVSVLVHRLALLALAGAALAARFTIYDLRFTSTSPSPLHPFTPSPLHPLIKWALVLLALALGGAGVYGVVAALGGATAGASGHVAAGPLLGLWLTLAHFSVDRGNIAGFLGLPLLVWVLPCAALTLWGLILLLRDARRGQRAAVVVLCMVGVPLLLLAVALFFAPVYEARYATVAFPAWVLVLGYPFAADRRPTTDDRRGRRVLPAVGRWVLLGGVLIINGAVLLQPQHGQFSGAPVKEQWRAAVTDIAHRAQPDDLILIQPYYVKPLWDYYAPRVTPDPLPQPVIFANFAEGDCAVVHAATPRKIPQCYRRRYEDQFNRVAKGKKRMLMLIAPEHANTVDPPKTLEQLRADWEAQHSAGEKAPTVADKYGWLGLRFQHAKDQNTWPCGGATFVGVETMCASFPAPFDATEGARPSPPTPATPLDATFGGEIKLLGYSITPFDGTLRAGGTLPVTLYWQSVVNPTQPYTMFLHLCRDCDAPPVASTDGAPLGGYEPAGDTTTWRGYPVHDERTLLLPRDLPPGRYTLLLGVYPPNAPGADQRLPIVTGARTLAHNRLVLGEVTVSAP